MKKAAKSGAIEGFTLNPKRMEEKQCDVCARTKATRQPIASAWSTPHCANFGDHIHMDLWGPAKVQTINHQRYTSTMIDDTTSWLEEPLMRSKDEAFGTYVVYEARLQTQYGIKVKEVRSDCGGEFTSQDFLDHLTQQGTIQRLTVHDTPQHNGLAERTHGTIFNMVRSMLISSGLPHNLWGEAHQHAVWLFNRTPHARVDFRTPYEMCFKSPPDLSAVRPFGSICYVKRDAGKLSTRAEECHWLGFDSTLNGVRV